MFEPTSAATRCTAVKPLTAAKDSKQEPLEVSRKALGAAPDDWMIRMHLAHIDHLGASIDTLDAEVDRVIAPFAEARDRLDTITGVGSSAQRDTVVRAAEPM